MRPEPVPPPSWIRSREARLWRRLTPVQAAAVLSGAFGAAAGAEALLRAYCAARDRDEDAARFWVAVFGVGAAGSPSPPGRPRPRRLA